MDEITQSLSNLIYGGPTDQAAIVLVLIMLWVLPWKGVALWKAVKLQQKSWFIALLVLNTLAILDIIYIFLVAKRKEKKEQI